MKTRRLIASLCVLSLAAIGCTSPPADPGSVLIANVLLLDGTGAAPVPGALRIRGERIAAAGTLTPLPGEAVLDGGGRVLAPGFIDTHSHHDIDLLEQRAAVPAVSQGITTIVRGQDGFSEVPAGATNTVTGFNAAFRAAPAAINVASYSPHGHLRSQVMGDDFRRESNADELTAMGELLRADLDAGALGLATGLEYDPGIYAGLDEMVTLARVAADAGGRYISHIRSEDRAFWAAIDEIIEIGRQAQIPVQVSHMKLAQKSLWGQAPQLLSILEAARADGVDITADVYPYEYWLSTVTVLFPDRDFDNPATAEYVLEQIVPADGLIFVRHDGDPALAGKSIADIAAARGVSEAAALTAVVTGAARMYADNSEAIEYVVGRSMRDADVQALLAWPHSNVCSDGSLASEHPRGSGSFPRVLSRYVRETGGLSLAEAVHKMTGLSAAHVGIADRGTLRVGAYADLVLFDPDTVQDHASMTDPTALSTGIVGVWVNGARVWDDGGATDARPGQIVHRAGFR